MGDEEPKTSVPPAVAPTAPAPAPAPAPALEPPLQPVAPDKEELEQEQAPPQQEEDQEKKAPQEEQEQEEQEDQEDKEPESEFAQHVVIDGNVLATSSRLDMNQLDRLLMHLADAVAKASGLRAKVRSIRTDLMVHQSITTAKAITVLLATLHIFPQVKAYFESTLVAVLQGAPIPSNLPVFEELKTGTHRFSDSEESDVENESELNAAATKRKKAPSSVASSSSSSRLHHKENTSTSANSSAMNTPTKPPATARGVAAASSSIAATATATPSATALALLERFASPEHHKNLKQTTLKFDPMLKSKPIKEAVKKPSRSYSPSPSPSPSRSGSRSPSSNPKLPPSVIRKRPLPSQDDEQDEDKPSTSLKIPRTSRPPASSMVPSRWEDLYYQPVPIVNVEREEDAQERINELRLAGNPFIIEGHDQNWMEFAKDWVRPDGTVNTDALLSQGLAECKVPVLEKNYEAYNPIKKEMSMGQFVRKHWLKADPALYMHQWQFPLHPKAAQVLLYKCKELPQLGDNLLNYWLDTVRSDNPLQYLFMGQSSTESRMHQDAGGLDILIAPISGSKRVRMLHRAASKLDSIHEDVQFHDIDLHKMPMLAFIPAWRTVIKPGQILYMPEGTWHACENVSPCLSYHRFHVDTINLPGFFASFLAQDAIQINHAEILWNAAQDIMAALDENYHSTTRTEEMDRDSVRKRDSLRALRHISRALSLEVAVPTEDSWEWNKLMDDIDTALAKVDSKASFFDREHRRKAPKRFVQVVEDDDEEEDGDDDEAEEEEEANAKALEEEDYSSDEVQIVEKVDVRGTSSRNRSKTTSRQKQQQRLPLSSTASHQSNSKSNLSKHNLDSYWDSLNLRVGDIVGVQVFEKRNRAKIREIRLNIELVQVHYVDWGSIYDEFMPVSNVYHRLHGKKSSGSRPSKRTIPYKTAPKVHDQVLAKWGTNGALYNAIVLKVLRSNACYVHYVDFENDWDQWILPGHIFTKYSK